MYSSQALRTVSTKCVSSCAVAEANQETATTYEGHNRGNIEIFVYCPAKPHPAIRQLPSLPKALRQPWGLQQKAVPRAIFLPALFQVLHERALVKRNEHGMETETIFAYTYTELLHMAPKRFRGDKRELSILAHVRTYRTCKRSVMGKSTYR